MIKTKLAAPLYILRQESEKDLFLVLDHDLAYERDSYFDLKISHDYIENLLMLQIRI